MIVQRHGIEFDMDVLAEICQRYHVRELSLFGSVLRADFRPDSDVDVLVEFEPETRMGLFTYFDLQNELQNLIGRNVDLVMKTGLKQVIRHDVLASSEVVYAV